MKVKRILFPIIFLIIANVLYAQKLEYMQPVGYQSPFLKSGQFITSLYYYSYLYKDNYDYATPPSTSKRAEKSLRFVGYLGITDQLTLTTRINYFPEQKIIWGENSTLDRSINLNVDPELTLSYRPMEYLEIFGNFDYHQYKTTQNATQVKVLVIVDYDPSTGDPIYEERTLSSFGHPPFTTTSTIFRIGVTYSGKLW